MSTLMQNLKTLAQHASADTTLAGAEWDGATLELNFAPASVNCHGTYRRADGSSHSWKPSSRLLLAAAERLRGTLPRSTRRVLVCIREGQDPWAMVHSDFGLGILPDEISGADLRMGPSEA